MLHIDWASWIRTSECSSQSAVPYRLAIAQRRKGGYRDSNPGPPEPQSGALTNCAIPTIYYYLHTPGLLSRHYGPTRHNHDTCPVCERVNEPGGIRTLDLRLRRPLLYPAELQTQIQFSRLVRVTAPRKRVMGIEPTYPAWKAGVLPLNYTRICDDRGDRI